MRHNKTTFGESPCRTIQRTEDFRTVIYVPFDSFFFRHAKPAQRIKIYERERWAGRAGACGGQTLAFAPQETEKREGQDEELSKDFSLFEFFWKRKFCPSLFSVFVLALFSLFHELSTVWGAKATVLVCQAFRRGVSGDCVCRKSLTMCGGGKKEKQLFIQCFLFFRSETHTKTIAPQGFERFVWAHNVNFCEH